MIIRGLGGLAPLWFLFVNVLTAGATALFSVLVINPMTAVLLLKTLAPIATGIWVVEWMACAAVLGILGRARMQAEWPVGVTVGLVYLVFWMWAAVAAPSFGTCWPFYVTTVVIGLALTVSIGHYCAHPRRGQRPD